MSYNIDDMIKYHPHKVFLKNSLVNKRINLIVFLSDSIFFLLNIFCRYAQL